MQNAEQQIGQLDLSTKKRICLYLFQEGIGYKRTAKILGLNIGTVRYYKRQFSVGITRFAPEGAFIPKDSDFIKIIKQVRKIPTLSIADACNLCNVQLDKILVYSLNCEKNNRQNSYGHSQCDVQGGHSKKSSDRETIGMGRDSKRIPAELHRRHSERSANAREVHVIIKKKRLDKINALITQGANITQACAVAKVSRSFYYRGKIKSRKSQSDDALALIIKNIQEKGPIKYSYGIERMTASINKLIGGMGKDARTLILGRAKVVNHKRVERIMRKFGLNARIKRALMPKEYYKANKEAKEKNKAPNLLKRDFFSVSTPMKRCVTDVTFLPCIGGSFLYLSPLMDLASQEIVNFEISVENGARMVQKMLCEIPTEVAQGLLLHSDQGAVYKSNEWVDLCERLQIQRSMSRKGNCWDNAVMENFFSRLKSDLGITKKQKKLIFTMHELRKKVIEYIWWYNNERIQKRLGYKSPVEYRKTIEKSESKCLTHTIVVQ